MYVRIAVNVDRWLLTYTSDSVNTGILALEVSVNIGRTPFSNVGVWPRHTRHFDNVQFRHFSSFTGRAQKCIFYSRLNIVRNISLTPLRRLLPDSKVRRTIFFFSNRDGRSTRGWKKKNDWSKVASQTPSSYCVTDTFSRHVNFPFRFVFPSRAVNN